MRNVSHASTHKKHMQSPATTVLAQAEKYVGDLRVCNMARLVICGMAVALMVHENYYGARFCKLCLAIYHSSGDERRKSDEQLLRLLNGLTGLCGSMSLVGLHLILERARTGS